MMNTGAFGERPLSCVNKDSITSWMISILGAEGIKFVAIRIAVSISNLEVSMLVLRLVLVSILVVSFTFVSISIILLLLVSSRIYFESVLVLIMGVLIIADVSSSIT